MKNISRSALRSLACRIRPSLSARSGQSTENDKNNTDKKSWATQKTKLDLHKFLSSILC